MDGATETKGLIMQNLDRRVQHIEDCGCPKSNIQEVKIETTEKELDKHDKHLDRLTTTFNVGVVVVIIFTFVSGANAVINLIGFVEKLVGH